MVSNYNTFQALSNSLLFVLTDYDLSGVQIGASGFSPFPFIVDSGVVNFVALPGSLSNEGFVGPIYVSSTNGDLWLEAGPRNPIAPPPPPRVKIDGNVSVRPGSVQTLSIQTALNEAFVLGMDGNLWLERGEFDGQQVPPPRSQIDGNVVAFQALSNSEIFVLGSDGKLWLEHAPFGQVPPRRDPVATNVAIPLPVASGKVPVVCPFQALSDQEVLVLDNGSNLWLARAPFGQTPLLQIDGNALAFQALSDSEVFVLGSDGNLWLENAPFGQVPPHRTPIDGNAVAFQALSDTEVFVLGSDGKLWLENAPFGQVPPPHRTLAAENVRLPIIF
jgi:hypothetical protein